MILDRGNIKWTAMMLSEHVAELRRWQNEEHYEERPQLDDFDLQAIQEEIEVAYKRKCLTFVKSWRNREIIIHSGIIAEINVESKCIMIDGPSGVDRMPVEDIIGVQCGE